ncbi:MAG: SDR family NAD(P)-dependent oxidoreductase [Candidatus Tectomicrobia bacterium]|uniref:SDR family NAD(P)-dependent oxidoreductase n=1 Tax=Tectimicrobiota bacterium TaxID=2528274 RepID=A0A932GNV2_UNCTE|nr:SDR family NAD(P)-dependent oxidoreductase [Candidatus Tectomicrobia bacterium]
MSQVVIITGGAGGIGSTICRGLAHDGHKVAIADFDIAGSEHLAKEVGDGALPVHVDVGNAESVGKMVEETISKFGQIDVLLNGAGIMPRTYVMTMPEEEWDRVLRVNLKGVFLCSQAVARHMVERRQGRIISIASGLGLAGAPRAAHYAASKAGVISFTKSLAVELAPHNVLVNAIGPGVTDTPMSRAGFSEEERKRRQSLAPILGGYTRVEDILGLIRYLMSEATRSVTGPIFFLTGPG